MDSQVVKTNSPTHDLEKPDVRPYSSAVGLTKAYAHDWESSHAFRELYQNWKDAIIEVNDLSLLEFNPHISDTEREILVAVHKHTENAGDGECLGYIKLNKATGVVEFANFGSMITSRSLELGYTTKATDARLAGRYGDGLKIAALVFCRHGYHVRIASDSRYYNFGFKGRFKNEFNYQMNPAGPDRIRRLQAINDANHKKGKPRRITANIWEDYLISVGSIRDHGERVTAEVFREWMKMTIDLSPPTALVRTAFGNLILDPDFAGHIYIKGIRVHLTDIKRTYRFGYDFFSGILNPTRDRRLDANPDDEARAVASIWEAAILRQEEMVLPQYNQLLRWHSSCADVAMADMVLTETTARKIWAVLEKDAKQAGTFYYPEGYADNNVHLIHHELKCEPDALPDRLWCLLRKFGLVRLPFEELYCRFRLSEVVQPPETLFARVIHRALAALLSAHPSTSPTKIVYVRCNDTRSNVVYSKERQILFINEKWLDFWRAHRAAPCEVSEVWQEDTEEFFCGHLITDVYTRAILAIMQPWDQRQLSLEHAHSLQGLVRECKDRICDMPTMVRLSRGPVHASLSVSWNDGYSRAFSKRYGSAVMYFVVLHGIACSAEKSSLWYRSDLKSCDCPHKVVPQAISHVVFEGLDGQPRFPMVARFRDRAIYGLPPDPLSPDNGPYTDTIALGLPLASGSEAEESDPYSPVLSFHSQYGASPLMTEQEDTENGSEHNETWVGSETRRQTASRSNSSSLENDEELFAEMRELYDSYIQLADGWEGQQLENVRALLNMLQAERRDTAMIPNIPGVMQNQGLRKGQYIEATLKAEVGQPRAAFFVHEIWEPCENHPARLLMTRYSFLSNCPAFATADSGYIDENELVLHFTDAENMGEVGDAEIYAVADILLARTNCSVHHVLQKPVLAGDYYYCRFAIQTRTERDACFLCPVRYAMSNNTDDSYAFSLLPQVLVTDMSPEDPGVSAGFSNAGYRIHRGVNGKKYNALWKMQNPNVQTYGSVEEALEASTQEIGVGACRVATISKAMSWVPDMSNKTGSQDNPFHHCRLVANHDNRPQFIFFNLPLAEWSASSSSELVKTILTLLKGRYSVYVRLCKTRDNSIEKGRSVFFLLASPHPTNPSWIKNAFADVSSRIHIHVSPFSSQDKSPALVAVTRGFSEELGNSVRPLNFAEILDSLPPSFTFEIATVISNICGRLSLRNQQETKEDDLPSSQPYWAPKGPIKKPKLFIHT